MFRLNYASKLALSMIALVILASVMIGYPMIHRQFSILEEQFNSIGTILSRQASINAVELVFSEDIYGIERLVNSFKEQPDVRSVIIINRDMTPFGTLYPRPDNELLTNTHTFKHASVFEDNNNLYWFTTPIQFNDITGGVAWIALDKTRLLRNQRLLISSALTVVFSLLLAIVLLAFRLSRTLSKPVNELIEAAQAVANGNLNYRIRNSDKGEFAELKSAFNQMTSGLAEKLTLEKNFSRFVSPSVASHYMSKSDAELSLQGERVEASIIYVDLVNYTRFSEKNPPEVVAETLNFYFSEFSDACHRFNGNVDKYIGDCAMLVFGCPYPDANHRKHALACAVYIRDRIKALNSERKEVGLPVMAIRIGIAGGTVLAGLLGSPERLNYSVIGEAANLAARLCDIAPTGGIMTDRAFLDAIDHQQKINTYETQRLHVKGFSEDIDTLVVDDIESIQELINDLS